VAKGGMEGINVTLVKTGERLPAASATATRTP